MGYLSDFFVNNNWGLLLMLAGVLGGIFAGVISDKVFGSRRGPVAALLYGLMLIFTIAMMPFVIKSNKTLKQEMTVNVYHKFIDRYAQHGEISLEKVTSKLSENYVISGSEKSVIDGDSVSVLKLEPQPGKKKLMLANKVGDLLLAKYDYFNKYQNKYEKRDVKVKNVGQIVGLPINATAYILGFIVVFMSLCVIGVHGMLSGTATMDFGGRRAAATAVGLIDGFVYLGTGFQFVCLGPLTELNWNYWPPFLIPFAVIGLILAIKIWHAFPHAKRKKGGKV